MLTLYDVGPTHFPDHLGTSPHVRKIIFTLNYKSLPFHVQIILPGDIEKTAKSIGISNLDAVEIKPNGSPRFTVPFLHDSTTGKTIMDSFLIAEYLDDTYLDTPSVIQASTRTLQAVFIDVVDQGFSHLPLLIFPEFSKLFSEEMLADMKKIVPGFFIETTTEERRELWRKGETSIVQLSKHYGGRDRFLVSDKLTFADLTVAAMYCGAMIAFGEESEEWKKVAGWGNGLVGRVVERALALKNHKA